LRRRLRQKAEAKEIKHRQIKTVNFMKALFLGIAILLPQLTWGQSDSEKDTLISNPNYDQVLAEKLGGDDYGMKSYFFVILKTGSNTTTDKEFVNKCFRGHLENISRYVDAGKLIVAGPFENNENNYRGLFILDNITTKVEAKELLETDPAIKNDLLDYEIYTWYGSAALPEYLPTSDKVWKRKP